LKSTGASYEQSEGINTTEETDMQPYFMAIAEDENKHLWMVTYQSGIWEYHESNLTHYPIQIENTPVQIFTIYQDRLGGLWLGTHNAGVWQYNGRNFIPFNP
jgi:ligand-binding sensor domain-containing protein